MKVQLLFIPPKVGKVTYKRSNLSTFLLGQRLETLKNLSNLSNLYETKRKNLLDSYRKKQSFRVSVGKSNWIEYNEFKPTHNLREILKDEIVIEFDEKHWDKSLDEFKTYAWKATLDTGVKLYQGGYYFEIWEHKGKSPHIHIHDLPISELSDDKRKNFKKFFIRKYVDKEFLPFVDTSLTGIHLIAIEYQEHWKGKYSVKDLWGSYNPQGANQNEM